MDISTSSTDCEMTEGSKLSILESAIASLYLNPKYSDVTLLVNGEELHAHKNILAVRSEYFEALLFGGLSESNQKTIKIEDVPSSEAFKTLLKYIYMGEAALDKTITTDSLESVIEIVIQAHKYCMVDLQQTLIKKIIEMITFDNICTILNVSTSYNLTELEAACMDIIEKESFNFLLLDLTELSQESLVRVLERDSFYAPEFNIFSAVLVWRKKNSDEEDRVLNCVRLDWVSSQELISQVYPTGLFESEKILRAAYLSNGNAPKETKSRGFLYPNKNVAAPELKPEILSRGSLNLFHNVKSINAEHEIGDEIGTVIRLSHPFFINCIVMRLYNEAYESYGYFIEISNDRVYWNRVVDRTDCLCRSIQALFFEETAVQYIRIVGTSSSVDEFRLVNFSASYIAKSGQPEIVGGYIRPIENVATRRKGAAVIHGNNKSNLLANLYNNFSHGYTYHPIVTPQRVTGTENITIQLSQPYLLSNMAVLMDNSTCKFYIETSLNNRDWQILVDNNGEHVFSRQIIIFPERLIVYIRIVGTYTAERHGQFRCFYFETPVVNFKMK